ncbi:flagellar motor protein MotB [Jannaschia aquimarina]|uniref:MotB protein n=1 Tax=Jannaschia aquimarina TaxID=935700 RepID=A0A0D1CRG8_9RHOB|nr:flagellar motor protein MotB [Jannaschia aquimarina]KIT17367.1 Motility protein B [Jannaschia aquimarina]SNS45448.1 chemotaxis protein MotB [Jannaschia aquimarina]
MSDSNRPIIIKRKKVSGGDGHHGGAWKVAYADFVTAMMAFFMLMWLLNATTDKQRKGLADYFNPTVPVARSSGGGDGAFGGNSLVDASGDVREGTGGITETQLAGFGEGAEESMRAVEDALLGRGGDSLVEDMDRRNVTARVTDEGLVIELFSLPETPLFTSEADPEPILRRLIATVVSQADRTSGGISIEAHVARPPLVRRDLPVWERSIARAQTARRLMLVAGLDETRLMRVTGHGDRRPAADPAASTRNDRIEIILLRPDA